MGRELGLEILDEEKEDDQDQDERGDTEQRARDDVWSSLTPANPYLVMS
jgi:hypothetical protein